MLTFTDELCTYKVKVDGRSAILISYLFALKNAQHRSTAISYLLSNKIGLIKQASSNTPEYSQGSKSIKKKDNKSSWLFCNFLEATVLTQS